ncbi:unnamed protein product [Owenia fusiformis]|uniref:Uncharacterized protein n=1 Tax=Owenia fusiformis TaxID=6347 RepID=A0A8J1TN35_OWEFU|nr:unnamed protein product [Owenia fusiformis]
MKKQAKTPASSGKPPPSSSSQSKAPLEKTNPDPTNGHKRAPSVEKQVSPIGSKLSKNLSKSHDNLASTLRRKANIASLMQTRPTSSLGIQPEKDLRGNKENLQYKSTPRKMQRNGAPIRKASSTQNMDKVGTPASEKTPVSIRKASSTQNMTKKGSTRQRSSAPANVMAYNAELLASFEKEKMALERRISELIQIAETRKADTEKLKYEVKNLREQVPSKDKVEEIEMTKSENKQLKDRLLELGIKIEQTDAEKLSQLNKNKSDDTDNADDSGDHRRSDSIEKSNTGTGDSIDDLDRCTIGTPDHPSSISLDNSNWDKQSNKSSEATSEISVACLHDRILQMEETHYSTSEELQATIQELTELQDTVNCLQNENDKLADERAVLLESLCSQTEKLENGRMQIEHLKNLLWGGSDTTCSPGNLSERELQLIELIKSAQIERDELFLKQDELSSALHHYERDNNEMQDAVTALRDKVLILESKNESISADKKVLDKQLLEYKETIANDQVEIQRYKTLLENERSKVVELEQYRNATDKSELEELLDSAREEKDRAEEKLADVQESLGHSQCEVDKLREELSVLEHELNVIKNNAKTEKSDFRYKLEKMREDRSEQQNEMDALREHIDQLEQDCDGYLEEKKSYNTSVHKLESELKLYKQKHRDLEQELIDQRIKHEEEISDWKQFQNDLQTAVVIANDIKTETQEDMETLQQDNADLREKVEKLSAESKSLKDENERLKAGNKLADNTGARDRAKTILDRELAAIRSRKLSSTSDGKKNENASVKTLIANLEDKQPLSPTILSSREGSSRRSSVDSNISTGSLKVPDSPCSPVAPSTAELRRSSAPGDTHLKSKINMRSSTDSKPPITHRHTYSDAIYEKSPKGKAKPEESKPVTPIGKTSKSETDGGTPKKSPALTSILANKPQLSSVRRNSISETEKDPLAELVKKTGGSKRNALLKWCQRKSQSYTNIDITNFSSSWNDGLGFCAIIHSYLPDKIPYKELNTETKRQNFTLAFKAAESVGIPSLLQVNDMVAMERPDWQTVMAYITSIYKHFEIDSK